MLGSTYYTLIIIMEIYDMVFMIYTIICLSILMRKSLTYNEI